jgi:four helix bundle protein
MENMGKKVYDLEERTEKFAKDCRVLIRRVFKNTCNIEDTKQLARSSGSVAANYIEANESLSRKDFYYRVKICRKEAKESKLWLTLIEVGDNAELKTEKNRLREEAIELMRIFGSIIEGEKNKNKDKK